jgi:RNA polymerase sigma-70 factor (ECF subfamily)
MDESERAEDFTRLLAKHQGRIYAYIYTIVPNRNDADEVFQEACVVLWRKFEEYRPGSNFFQWAARVAYYKVLSFRKQKKRSLLIGSDTFVEAVAEEMNARADLLEERELALADCIAKLREKDRDLINRRYAPGGTVKAAAKQLERPIKSIYAALGRVRQALLECVERTLATEEGR